MKRFRSLFAFLLAVLLLLPVSLPLATAADVAAPETAVNVGATSTAVSTNATRRLLILINYSDETIYCKSGGRDAVVGEGWVLNPQPAAAQAGGSVFFDIQIPTGAINCIHGGSGDKVLLKIEG